MTNKSKRILFSFPSALTLDDKRVFQNRDKKFKDETTEKLADDFGHCHRRFFDHVFAFLEPGIESYGFESVEGGGHGYRHDHAG